MTSLFFVQRAVEKQPGHTQNAVQGSPKLVADAGEELSSCALRRQSFVTRSRELASL